MLIVNSSQGLQTMLYSPVLLYHYLLKNAAISVEQVDKFVVVKTLTGAASAAAEAIDSLYTNDVAGTIAGDNTIFVLVRSDEKAVELISKIRKMIS